jgi:hypothetical protein
MSTMNEHIIDDVKKSNTGTDVSITKKLIDLPGPLSLLHF